MISLQANKTFNNDYITKPLFFLQCLQNKERKEELTYSFHSLFIKYIFYLNFYTEVEEILKQKFESYKPFVQLF